MPATYEAIGATTLGSASSTITFSSIPNTYTDLKLILVAKVQDTNANIVLTLNGSTTTYSQNNIYTAGSSRTADRLNNFDGWYITQADLGSTTIPTMYIVDIFSYTGSTFKGSLFTSSQDKNGSGAVLKGTGLWRNTNAVTSVGLLQPSNFSAGTTATLYGIKSA
jgi:hypothetical protein